MPTLARYRRIRPSTLHECHVQDLVYGRTRRLHTEKNFVRFGGLSKVLGAQCRIFLFDQKLEQFKVTSDLGGGGLERL